MDLDWKLKACKDYYNCHRPHGSIRGRAPYEVLKHKLESYKNLSPEV
jgi:uncharacterized CHY-type Zn-finger protein